MQTCPQLDCQNQNKTKHHMSTMRVLITIKTRRPIKTSNNNNHTTLGANYPFARKINTHTHKKPDVECPKVYIEVLIYVVGFHHKPI